MPCCISSTFTWPVVHPGASPSAAPPGSQGPSIAEEGFHCGSAFSFSRDGSLCVPLYFLSHAMVHFYHWLTSGTLWVVTTSDKTLSLFADSGSLTPVTSEAGQLIVGRLWVDCLESASLFWFCVLLGCPQHLGAESSR